MFESLVASSSPFIDWTWINTNSSVIIDALEQHAELTGIAIGCGLGVSLPIALLAWRYRITRTAVLGFAGLLYTIPSLALFVLIQPLTGYFSLLTAEVALVGYTLLILVRNLLTGLDAATAEVREAATAMGYTATGAMARVYLPLALPALFAGLRVATVTVVGLVTITAFVGWGGLGQVIITGFHENFYTPIIVGLVLSVALAALGDAMFVVLERVTVRWSRSRNA
jgi:osmoprotectant transport system permease protein